VTVVESDLPAVAAPPTFTSHNPATGEVVGTHAIAGDDEVAAAVERGRRAAAWWSGLGFDGRARRLRAWRGVLARRQWELAELVRRENGKPTGDAFLEILLTIDHISWAAKHAPRVLGRQRVASGLNALNQASSVEYLPMGVVGVIGPWNYPVLTPMGSIVYALAAGNAVVFKPSEYTPGVGVWLAKQFAAVVAEHPVFQVVTGLGDTGAALCRSGVDKLAFTGSARTGRKVMAACAERLTPMVIEAGGKDAMIVAADADLDAAADAAVWGGMSNAGQTCIGVERVYVEDSVADAFTEKVAAIARGVRPGSDAEADYGPITMPAQVDVIERHIADALDRGGRAVVGGRDSVRRPFVDPVVLVDVPEDSDAVREETFGPTLVVNRVRSVDEAIERANGTAHGLASAVFSRRHGAEIARRLRAGMTSINSVVSFAAVPALPFGGVGESGFGRIHGADGLREFARPKSTTRQRFALPVPLMSFSRPPSAVERLGTLVQLLHGRR